MCVCVRERERERERNRRLRAISLLGLGLLCVCEYQVCVRDNVASSCFFQFSLLIFVALTVIAFHLLGSVVRYSELFDFFFFFRGR